MWHDINCRDRILKWREWRNGLKDLTLDECLKEVAAQWAKAPVVNHYLFPDNTDEWPDPWNLINDNIYCDLAITIGMFYTLALCDNPNISDDVAINIYKTEDGWVNLCSVDGGLYMLNWEPRSIVNISTISNLGDPFFVYTKIDLTNKLH